MFISAIESHRAQLKKFFERKKVAHLSELRKTLGVRSRTTVFFALKAAGYCTSYSHAGRYYTLARVPEFDARGLWFHGEVRFSKHGSLRATMVVLVREAKAGYTHEELAVMLGLRVHDTLRALVEDRLLRRECLDAVYVYVDLDPKRATAQLDQRRRIRTSAPTPTGPLPPLDLARVVDVLLAVIHAPRDDSATIAARLRQYGLTVTTEQIEAVFVRYGLQKKTARSRSKLSRS
ncbi:MAG: hypothetical protein AAB403_11910 [Planctomycetota bacterium]